MVRFVFYLWGNKKHMKYKKIFSCLVFVLLMLMGGIVTVDAQILKREIKTNVNQQVYIGEAAIIGDGSEENTTVEAVAETNIVIKIDTNPSYIDLIVNYSMVCNGSIDSGIVSLLVQINSEDKGHVETGTLTNKTGELIFEDLEVNGGDVLTFQIGAVYTNAQPFFTTSDVAIGNEIITKKTRTILGVVYDNSKILSGEESSLMKTGCSLDNPPDPPVILGPATGKKWKMYTFNVTVSDPDGDDLQRIEIDFGDATSGVILSDWFSGDAIQVFHKWRRTGSYQIKVRVQDAYGAWSDWGYHMILIQRS